MILYPKDYVAPDPPAKPELDAEDVKARIRAFVTEPRYYEQIVVEIQDQLFQEDKYATTDEIVKLIREIDAEWHPPAEPEAPEKI